MAEFKEFCKGDSFTGTVYFAPRKGGLTSLIGYTAESVIKDSAGQKHYATSCVIAADGLSCVVTFSASTTAQFALGIATWKVRFSSGASVFSTKAKEFKVTDDGF